MTPIRRCLFPTNFDELSRSVAPFAAEMVRHFDAELRVVHVAPLAPSDLASAPVPTHPVIGGCEASDFRQREGWLAEFCGQHFAGLPKPPITAVLAGPPALTIASYAREHHVDLLIVPTHACGVLRRIFLGSVSKSILESASCPVLMVPAASVVAGQA